MVRRSRALKQIRNWRALSYNIVELKMMPYSLRNLLFSIISGFLLVIALSLTLNQVTLKAHTTHNEVLSVAYHLRMTTQKLVSEVSSSGYDSLDLSASTESFDQELRELKEYGKPQVRPIGDFIIYPSILHDNYNPELAVISVTWSEFISDWDKLSKLLPSDPDYAVAKLKVMGTLTNLFAQVDSFSITLEALDDMQDQNQTKEQIFILGSGLLMLVWGWYVIIFRIIRPLSYLDTAVRGIGQGENTFSIKVSANDEMGRLARSFETMRMEISAAQKLLEDRVEERTAILSDAFEFSQEIVSQPDFNKLVASITQRTKNIMHTKSVSLCLATHDMKRLELVSKSGDVSVADGEDRLVLDQLPPDIMTGVQDASGEVDEICKKHQLQISEGCLSVPLSVGGHNIGALCVLRDKNMLFTEIENYTLKLLANSAAVAIANIRLGENSRRQTELNATLNERQRLTSELHDEAAQTLGLLNLKVGALDDLLSGREKETVSVELEQFKQLTQRAQAQMRMAFSGMNTVTVEKHHDFHKELTDYVMEFRKANGIQVELTIDDLASLAIPALIQKQAMYIYREALTNVRRYANAKNVQVQLEKAGAGIQLVVSDDGRGFDPNLSKSEHHLGMAVMQARMERVGGTLSIETAPGAGTRVIANIPIAAVPAVILNEGT